MTPAIRSFVALVAVTVVASVSVQLLHDDPRHARPPHPQAANAAAQVGTTYLANYPGEVIAILEWQEGERDGEWFRGIEVERLAVEVAQARTGDVRRPVSGTPTSLSGDCAALTAAWNLPVEVLIRESRCSEDAYNPTGCNGRSCIGAAQLDLGHFAAVSPWNGNVSGTCYGLDPGSIADQRECASRLGPGAWR